MFSTPAHLHVQQPSPTTIGFRVSNASPNITLTQKAVTYGVAVLRVLLSVGVLATLFVKSQCASALEGGGEEEMGRSSLCLAWLDPVFTALMAPALRSPWHVVGPACALILYVCCRRPYTEESLLVLQSLGIQTSTSSSTYLSTATSRFIPTDLIQDIFIHEAFIGFEVKFYLAIVVKGEAELTVVFPKLLPRRHILEEVWRGARSCMFASTPHGSKNALLSAQAKDKS